MGITYKFSADATYYRTIIERYYRQRPFIFHLPVQFGILALFVSCVFVFAMSERSWLVISFAAVLGVCIWLGGAALTRLGILSRFKYGLDFGKEVTVRVSEDGIDAVGAHSQGNWSWSAYPHSVRYPDGILLLRPGALRWLPDAALLQASPNDAIALVSAKSALRYVT